MSRYTVQITNGTTTDEEGTIGYDRPLRTFFLQAFPDPETDECALWLGAFIEEYPTLESIIEAARAQGYEVRGMTQKKISVAVSLPLIAKVEISYQCDFNAKVDNDNKPK